MSLTRQMNSNTQKKILFLSSNPKTTKYLRLDEEIREIDAGLMQARHRDKFVLEQKWAVRPRDIQRAMLDINPQIVHFSGHGMGDEGLVFEDETGQAKLVDGEALAGLFDLFADQIECVLLNGCYSEVQAEAIAQHVNYVIGMKNEIGDKAAIEFAVGFYDALGSGRSVEFAHKFACAAIRLAGIPEHLTPVLKKKPSTDETTATQHLAPYQPLKNEATSSSKSQAIEIFFSYAHEDEKLRDELAKHLKILQRQGVIKAWYDREISAGTEWAGKIDVHMDTANIILLLISADFLASDYCYDIELTRAMERHAAGEARVIPVMLREVDWKGAPFGKLQALPKNAEPVTNWENRDQAFTDVAKGIRKAVEELTSKK
ncbi:MAG: TIR domain-containing protein [Calothrix sp. MO_167.B42]|nr:TIR domain-containing protein [Calothrix sp. MO_167.B42]